MHCPYCTSIHTDVVETRVNEDGYSIRRRRSCTTCGKRFTTYERIENVVLIVKKKDGKREQFLREKLRSGIIKSCGKTSITPEQISTIVDTIEKDLLSADTVEIGSTQIGEMVASHLKTLDKVAYIRFASVFKRFVDVEDFEKELQKLIK